jgi:hypothetical protein
MEKKFKDKGLTLTDGDISSRRSVTRRSLIGLGLLGAAATAIVAGPNSGLAQQRPQPQPGCTDNDRGPNQDPPDMGRRCRGPMSGCTDNDRGPREDPPGGGRWCWI